MRNKYHNENEDSSNRSDQGVPSIRNTPQGAPLSALNEPLDVVYLENNQSRHHSNQSVILRGNTGQAGPLPILTTGLTSPLNVVSVNIDTRQLREPIVLLTFTSQINVPFDIVATLNFEITKSINGGTPQHIGGTYTFSNFVQLLESNSFSFQFFEGNVIPGYFTYSINLSTNTIIQVTPGLTLSATLTVLAVEN
ncbi:MAG: DUF4489 domain-containing protein [Clostridiaceae bacterium]|nr:DUF4489 domain-containing protein [Clostridiaceae bacterium]